MHTRTETFRDLYHGTDAESALKICEEGFIPSSAENNWCGSGVYFYDIKAKAWWSANRTCRQKNRQEGRKFDSAIIVADIIDILRNDIFDLRSDVDMRSFQIVVQEIVEGVRLGISELNETERTIKLRSLLIEFFAKKYQKKLVVGMFQQRPNEEHAELQSFSNGLDIIFGAELIYCVKDLSILQNIRRGGMKHEENIT